MRPAGVDCSRVGDEESRAEGIRFGARAVLYIREELAKGHDLARHLLERPLEEGRVATYLPEEAEPHLLNFESGGVGSGQENLKVAELIKEGMDQAMDGIPVCILEHPGASKGWPFLTRGDWPHFTVGDDVYLFAHPEESVEAITKIVREIHWYPGIGAASTLPTESPRLSHGEERDPELLRVVADRAELVVIAAYDAEGWLVWRPSARSSES
jgi:hypothetical protein